jgi:hypothetical protein
MMGRGYDAEDGEKLVSLPFRLLRLKMEKEKDKQETVSSKFLHLSLASVRFGC